MRKKPIRQTQGKHFYSHIVETSLLSLELGEMDMTQEERVHLVSLAESQLHHVIVDIVLSELSDEDKKTFLHHLSLDDHEKIWHMLHTKVESIEEKIQKAAEELKAELHKDIREIREKSK